MTGMTVMTREQVIQKAEELGVELRPVKEGVLRDDGYGKTSDRWQVFDGGRPMFGPDSYDAALAWLMGYEQGVAHERGIYDATFKASDPRTARVYPTPDHPLDRERSDPLCAYHGGGTGSDASARRVRTGDPDPD